LYTGAATAPWTWQGNIYGIGNELNAVLMFYRWDLYENAGLEHPGTTWEEFIENGKKLAATGVKTLAINDQGWEYWWIIASAGNGFFDSQGAVAADNEFGRKTLQLLYDLLHTHEIAMVAPLDAAYYGAMQADAFAVHLGAPWYQGFMKDNAASLAGKWKMMPLPVFADGSGAPTATHGGTGTVITNQSRYPDIAWEFIKFANLTVEGQIAAFNMANLFPTYTPAWTDDRLYRTDDYFSGQRPAEIISQVAPLIPPLNNSPYWPEVTDAFTRLVITPVLQNTTTIDRAMQDFRREVDRIMR
ncbi:MAG: extracellular solute-binding protein, partial [Clostridia bacterium]